MTLLIMLTATTIRISLTLSSQACFIQRTLIILNNRIKVPKIKVCIIEGMFLDYHSLHIFLKNMRFSMFSIEFDSLSKIQLNMAGNPSWKKLCFFLMYRPPCRIEAYGGCEKYWLVCGGLLATI
jgi:hypothetical protein